MDNSFKKTVIRVEVLSRGDWDWETLNEVAYAITDGNCSGIMDEESVTYLSEKDVASELMKQGSNPEFLLGEGWEEHACN